MGVRQCVFRVQDVHLSSRRVAFSAYIIEFQSGSTCMGTFATLLSTSETGGELCAMMLISMYTNKYLQSEVVAARRDVAEDRGAGRSTPG